MRNEPKRTETDELDDLLDAERAALLAGDLEGLTRLHERKSALISELSELKLLDGKPVRGLMDKLERNHVLLESAMEGIRSVSRRLAAIRQVRQSLDTYDARGQKKRVDMDIDRSFEKRA